MHWYLLGAQASSEARYQKERAERLQGMLDTAQQESTSALQRRLSIEKSLLDSHQALRSKDDRIADLQESLRMSQDAQRRAEIEAEVAKGSEGTYSIYLTSMYLSISSWSSLSTIILIDHHHDHPYQPSSLSIIIMIILINHHPYR